MALLQLLLEQSVAGRGAGQQQPEALETEAVGSEVSFVPRARRSAGVDPGHLLVSPPGVGGTVVRHIRPAYKDRHVSAEQCVGAQGAGMWLPSGSPPRLHLLVRRDEAQELVHMAHEQPVGVEPHRGLHLLGTEEVLHGLVHLLALSAANTGLTQHYGKPGKQGDPRGNGGLAKGSRCSFSWGRDSEAWILSSNIGGIYDLPFQLFLGETEAPSQHSE